MQSRRLFSLERTVAIAAAVVATVGSLNCAPFVSRGVREGTLDGTLSSSDAVRARATLDEIRLSAAGTYIERLLSDRDSTIERWPDHLAQPLRVWIDSSSVLRDPQAGFPNAVRSAFAEWTSTGIPLRFVFVISPKDADLRIRWTEHLEHKTGSTTWRTDRAGWLVSGDITLATHISDGQPLDGRGMRAIALHEVGHALGMSHSLDPHDIMASLVRVDELSAPDRNTIKLLYELSAGRVR